MHAFAWSTAVNHSCLTTFLSVLYCLCHWLFSPLKNPKIWLYSQPNWLEANFHLSKWLVDCWTGASGGTILSQVLRDCWTSVLGQILTILGCNIRVNLPRYMVFRYIFGPKWITLKGFAIFLAEYLPLAQMHTNNKTALMGAILRILQFWGHFCSRNYNFFCKSALRLWNTRWYFDIWRELL